MCQRHDNVSYKATTLFHKNFDYLRQSFEDALFQGYHIYILADSDKQQQRLRDILNDMSADDASDKLETISWLSTGLFTRASWTAT